MKFLALIICLFLLTDCQKDDSSKFYYGEISMKLNNNEYVRDLETISVDTMTPKMFGIWLSKTTKLSKDFSFRSESMSISARKVLLRQELKDRDSMYKNSGVFFATFLDDGDVLGDFFRINNNSGTENYIEITQQNNDFKEIWGNFQFEMIKDSINRDSNSPYPDTLRFTEGKFHLYFK